VNDLTANTIAVGPTLWGRSPAELHHAFWRQCGLAVVTPGAAGAFAHNANIFLLTDTDTLVLFHPRQAIDRFCWLIPRLLCLRLHAKNLPAAYRLTRLGLTAELPLAEAWSRSQDTSALWRSWRREIPQMRRAVMSQPGRICRQPSMAELTAFMERLAVVWRNPEAQIDRAQKVNARVWKDAQTPLAAPVPAHGAATIWMGAGQRAISPPDPGKAIILWDAPPDSAANRTPQANHNPLTARELS